LCDGGFLPGDEDVPGGGGDNANNLIIQPPTAECPHFRIVPASGFIQGADTTPLVAMSAAAGARAADASEGSMCCECGASSTSSKYQESFGVAVCQSCIDSNTESYGLVTKTTAIDEYCIGEKEMEGLGCIRRRNPRKQGWNEMRLFLRAQVAQRSIDKHGTVEGLEQARRKRAEEAARRKREREGRESVLRSSQVDVARTPEAALADDGSGGLAGGMRRRKGGTDTLLARAMAPRHVHVWGLEWQEKAGGGDGGGGGDLWWRKCEGCGLVTSYEKL
jgi:DNA repair protein